MKGEKVNTHFSYNFFLKLSQFFSDFSNTIDHMYTNGLRNILYQLSKKKEINQSS